VAGVAGGDGRGAARAGSLGRELTHTRKDGTQIVVLSRQAVQRDEEGKPVAVIELNSDITKRKAATDALRGSERQLRELNEHLERRVAERTAGLQASNRELEAFAYTASHDLALRSGRSTASARSCSKSTPTSSMSRVATGSTGCAAAQRMGTLIDDMLELSRIVRAELQREPVDLSALAHQTLKELRDGSPHRQVDLVVADRVLAPGDPTLLRSLLENLLGNAWKFTAPHDAARIEFGQTEHNGERTYFVRDDGVGFDMAYEDQLFMPFQRLHPREEIPGTEIGLAVVDRIVRRHDGHIWVEAQPEKGATFYFTLEGKR
jgi:two-component system, sensor histidine kinase and response regulator